MVWKPKIIIGDPKLDYFIIKGRVDSNYATSPETRKSISGLEVILNGAAVVMRSVRQKIIALSVIESELIEDTQVAQEIRSLQVRMTETSAEIVRSGEDC